MTRTTRTAAAMAAGLLAAGAALSLVVATVGPALSTAGVANPATAANAATPASTGFADRVAAVRDGQVVFRFETWPDVYGDGDDSIMRGTIGGESVMHGTFNSDDDGWKDRRNWIQGPMSVVLTIDDGKPTRLKARVGEARRSSSRPVTDLGLVAPQEAADFLLLLAERSTGPVAEDAIMPALFARDARVWPGLVRIARDQQRPADVRKSALFWLGEQAGEAASAELTRVADADDEEGEIREAAVFALSRRPEEESIPLLTRLATTSPHPEVRKSAFFWLAQSEDPRVIDLFEQTLLDGR